MFTKHKISKVSNYVNGIKKYFQKREYFDLEIINFPDSGLHDGLITERLNKALNENIDYSKDYILGYPGTIPLKKALDVLIKFMPNNANNIGTHTRIESEAGFKGTQNLEREAIAMMGSLFGADNQENKVDGYITSGGTEGNITSLWILRNYFKHNKNQVPVVLKSPLTHYSIQKALNILNLDKEVTLQCNKEFEIDIKDLESKIRDCAENGSKVFILVATIGYTVSGSVDRIDEINDLINQLNTELNIEIKIHVDTAHGGFIYPFIAEENFGFNFNNVYTISVDAHKLGLLPYSCGVFLCRKNLQRYIETDVDYIKSHYDDTLIGSRSGAMAAALWSAIMSLGKQGYREIHEKSIRMKDYFIRELNNNGIPFWYYSNEFMNIICIEFLSIKDNRLSKEVEQKYGLNLTTFSCDDKTRNFYKIVFMPHVNNRIINLFIHDIMQESQ